MISATKILLLEVYFANILTTNLDSTNKTGARDGIRTRDLCRDRAAF